MWVSVILFELMAMAQWGGYVVHTPQKFNFVIYCPNISHYIL